MNTQQRVSAALSYIPVIGWIYALIFSRKDEPVMYHLKQSISLVIGLVGIFLLWAVSAWIITWIPYGVVFAVALFTLVVAALLVGVIAWVVGIVYALLGKESGLPLFGAIAERISF